MFERDLDNDWYRTAAIDCVLLATVDTERGEYLGRSGDALKATLPAKRNRPAGGRPDKQCLCLNDGGGAYGMKHCTLEQPIVDAYGSKLDAYVYYV